MPKRVHLPDGRIVNFPDAMTPDQIQAAMVKLSGAAPPASEPPADIQPRGTVFGRPLRPDLDQQIESADAMDAPLAPNIVKGAQLVGRLFPSSARAGAKFQAVMSAAKDVPVDVSSPGNAALRIMQMSERGGTLPKAVRDFLRRVTDPDKGPLRYEEARDFASNISRLSADEFSRLTPALRREMGNLRVTLNHAVEKAASSVGHGGTYRSAMGEYARAARGRQMVDDTKEAVKRWAIPGGIAVYTANKLSDLLRGD